MLRLEHIKVTTEKVISPVYLLHISPALWFISLIPPAVKSIIELQQGLMFCSELPRSQPRSNPRHGSHPAPNLGLSQIPELVRNVLHLLVIQFGMLQKTVALVARR